MSRRIWAGASDAPSELTCHHVDPQAAPSPGEEAILETKILVVRGSLDDVFKMAMQQRGSLKP